MHTLAVQIAPVLAAEKSKVPFYIAGGLLVLWALTVSLGLGLRKPDFPGSLAGQRAVTAVTLVLVIAAVSTAVITSGTPAASGQSGSVASESKATEQQAPSSGTSSPGASATKQPGSSRSPAGTTPAAKSPTASTGRPAPASSPAASATTKLKLAANPAGQLAYDTKQLSAKAGTVTIEMTNMSPIEHDVAVSEGSKILGQTPVFSGGSKSVTLKLKPGTYTFFCTVPGHRQAGMEGTLSVS
ncbi:MAG TPA: plastocyanin/azurin family copper-binding protein [Solirubrobacteraceae bacterium]|nr:plastocyanin/azurin family copper-binding protein [Solirubrobacteraceae bacterium]